MHEFPDIRSWSLLWHVTREVTRLIIYLAYAFAFKEPVSFAFQHRANLFRRVYNKDWSGVANMFLVIHMVWEGTRVVHLIWALFPSLRKKNLACGRKLDNYKSFQTRSAGFEICCRHEVSWNSLLLHGNPSKCWPFAHLWDLITQRGGEFPL